MVRVPAQLRPLLSDYLAEFLGLATLRPIRKLVPEAQWSS
jgi:hypothetical protein